VLDDSAVLLGQVHVMLVLLMVVAWLAPAFAASVRVVVEVGPEGAKLSHADLIDAAPKRVTGPPSAHRIEILDQEGKVLAEAWVPDPRMRSVVAPIGPGQAASLDRGVAQLRLAWPPGAALVRLGDLVLTPTWAPPAPSTAAAVQQSGDAAERLDLVFLGDGYTAEDQASFEADVDRTVAHVLGLEPYGSYTGMFNIWRVDTVSNESGASHYDAGQDVTRDTAFGCYYGCAGIDRLICCDDGAVLATLAAALPDADGVVVLVNDETYGGSGGTLYATSYTGTDFGPEVAAHEMGHSLVGLWDEYDYGISGSGAGAPNCSASSTAPTWTDWLGDEGVDAFAICAYGNLYRPTEDACMMRTLQDGYCAVCRQEVVLAIFDALPGLITATEPPEGAVTIEADTVFSATLLGPDAGLELSWTMDGSDAGAEQSLTVEGCGSPLEVMLTVTDITPWVRSDPQGLLSDQAAWSVSRPDCTEEDVDTGPAVAVDGGADDPDDSRRACGCQGVGGAAAAPLLAIGLGLVLSRRRRDAGEARSR
jgi:uncharacterized protein (TIGR03382 family)